MNLVGRITYSGSQEGMRDFEARNAAHLDSPSKLYYDEKKQRYRRYYVWKIAPINATKPCEAKKTPCNTPLKVV